MKRFRNLAAGMAIVSLFVIVLADTAYAREADVDAMYPEELDPLVGNGKDAGRRKKTSARIFQPRLSHWGANAIRFGLPPNSLCVARCWPSLKPRVKMAY